MKKSFVVFAAVLLFALTAVAQDVPKVETFLGYTYVRANSATDVPSFSANGGGGTLRRLLSCFRTIKAQGAG